MCRTVGSRLVDYVYRLVGKESVVYVFGSHPHGVIYAFVCIFHAVELLVLLFQSVDNPDSLLYIGLGDVNLLEPPHYATTPRHVPVVLVVGGGTDETYVAVLHIGLQHVRGVERSVASTSGTHHVVNLVYVDNGVALGAYSVHDELHSFLEVASELRSGEHRAHVHLIDMASLELLRHVAFYYLRHESTHKSRLSDARFAHVQRVVLVFATQYLYGALHLLVAPYERRESVGNVVHACHETFPCLFRLLFGFVRLLL